MWRRRKQALPARRLSKICVVLPLFTCLAADDVPVIRVETRLVVLHATALDPAGLLLMDLPPASFQVFENGVRQKLQTFRREDVPVSLGLIIDNSASMRDKREQVIAAALALIEASNREDEAFVVNFAESPSLAVDFTSDAANLKRGLLSRIGSEGGTAMRDAVYTAIEHVRGRNQKDKRVLLVVTDGNDNCSTRSLEGLVRAAQQAETLVYAVGLLNDESPGEAAKARRELDILARATGGQAYYPKETAEIREIAPRIAHEIRSQYILAYHPSNQDPDGAFRQIRVLVDRPGAAIRTRSGYYAPER
ncbi:MAG: VWA domain-containing protein [Acidobacteria bacterium]|nr:VWA domain-containing protein [Acidobacteriota bacterium]MBI3472705.1 VWA domain-containing protein [Candidatus Solibacter usitatus]